MTRTTVAKKDFRKISFWGASDTCKKDKIRHSPEDRRIKKN